ncbi:MAG: glutathione synthase [Legionellales bacterium]|nr:glutathione synthase [Legionellales bacterium]
MKMAVLMDPLAKLDPSKDSSLAILSQACARQWQCSYFTLSDLFAQDGEAFAKLTPIIVDTDASHWKESRPELCALAECDILLIRKDPPFDLSYLYATQILDLAEQRGVLVSNKPQSLRNHNEKLSLLQHPDLCPPTLVSMDMTLLQDFWHTHESVIFKPLDSMGGGSIFHVDANGTNLNVILETLTAHATRNIMAQRYIPELIQAGDKRIILIDGEPIPYALARFPKQGESRANLAAGGSGRVVPITERDRTLCEALKPSLQAQDLHFVGLDVIGDYVTEINVTSPTCIRQISAETGLNIAGDYLAFLESRR